MEPGLQNSLELIARYQTQRLTETYDDFCLQRGFDRMPSFLCSYLYGCPDRHERDSALTNARKQLMRLDYGRLTRTIAVALEDLTNAIDVTDKLDRATAARLGELLSDGVELNDNAMLVAWRNGSTIEERKAQVALVAQTLSQFFQIGDSLLINVTIKPLRVILGSVCGQIIVQMIDDALAIKHQIRDVDPFIQAFIERENAYLTAIYAS